jgi:hypothetical protein
LWSNCANPTDRLLTHTCACLHPQVSEWLTWCTTELALLLDDKLVKVCIMLWAATAAAAATPCSRMPLHQLHYVRAHAPLQP